MANIYRARAKHTHVCPRCGREILPGQAMDIYLHGPQEDPDLRRYHPACLDQALLDGEMPHQESGPASSHPRPHPNSLRCPGSRQTLPPLPGAASPPRSSRP